jgi:transcriptional regulator with XRE-family HTH domain
MSDASVVAELGQRIQQERLNQNLSQETLAKRAGISRRALQYLETKGECTLASLMRVLRVLGKLDALDTFLPATQVSPVQLARLRRTKRQRAGGKRNRKESNS